MRFFPKGLNHFKNQTRFKFYFLLNFIIQNPERYGSWSKTEICSIWNFLSPCKVLEFLELWKYPYHILQSWSFGINWKFKWISWLDRPQCSVAHRYSTWTPTPIGPRPSKLTHQHQRASARSCPLRAQAIRVEPCGTAPTGSRHHVPYMARPYPLCCRGIKPKLTPLCSPISPLPSSPHLCSTTAARLQSPRRALKQLHRGVGHQPEFSCSSLQHMPRTPPHRASTPRHHLWASCHAAPLGHAAAPSHWSHCECATLLLEWATSPVSCRAEDRLEAAGRRWTPHRGLATFNPEPPGRHLLQHCIDALPLTSTPHCSCGLPPVSPLGRRATLWRSCPVSFPSSYGLKIIAPPPREPLRLAAPPPSR
jgi:hypothetical protein